MQNIGNIGRAGKDIGRGVSRVHKVQFQ